MHHSCYWFSTAAKKESVGVSPGFLRLILALEAENGFRETSWSAVRLDRPNIKSTAAAQATSGASVLIPHKVRKSRAESLAGVVCQEVLNKLRKPLGP
jgi:hypothetical protein